MRILEHEYKCPICGEMHECGAKEVDTDVDKLDSIGDVSKNGDGTWTAVVWWGATPLNYIINKYEATKLAFACGLADVFSTEDAVAFGWVDDEEYEGDMRLFVRSSDGSEWRSEKTLSQM